MNYITNKNTLTFSNKANVDFEYPILKTLEVDHVLIVVLDIPSTCSDNRNVFAFSITASFLWQVKDVELYYKGNCCGYVGITINNESEVILFNWCDTAIVLNPQTGDIIRKYQTK